MKAHKVPATYYDGWEISGLSDRFYVFYTSDTNVAGITKRYRDVSKITTEHSFFMEENFYYIDLSIDGIEFKLVDEINDFFNTQGFKVQCVDDLAETVPLPLISICDHNTYMKYKNTFNTWAITDKDGKRTTPCEFQKKLNEYVFYKVGKLIEENYFANYLENMWNDIKSSIKNDIVHLRSEDAFSMSRKSDFLEFFIVQYLRVDKRIKNDIIPILNYFEKIFDEMGIVNYVKSEGMLSPDVYFFGILLDAARGNKTGILKQIKPIEAGYVIDILEAPNGCSFITSTSPCVFSQIVNGIKEEMLFPLDYQYCVRFRSKKEIPDVGKYIKATISETKAINNSILANSEDIVISECEYITSLI